MFDRIFAALAAEGGLPERLMIASTHLKAHRTAASLLKKGLFPAASGDPQGRADLQAPRRLRRPGTPRRAALLTVGQVSDHRGAAIVLPRLPPARELIADRDYDSARLTALRALPPARTGLQTRGIPPSIPSTRSRKRPITHNPARSRQHQRIEIIVGRLKDWRRIAMRDDQRAHTFLAAITLAATVIFWLSQ